MKSELKDILLIAWKYGNMMPMLASQQTSGFCHLSCEVCLCGFWPLKMHLKLVLAGCR